MNPLKLTGSYIGLAVGLALSYFSFAAISVLCEFGQCKPAAFILPVIPAVIGFLIGWGIHAIIRKK